MEWLQIKLSKQRIAFFANYTYFDTEKVKPVDLWSQLLSLGKNKSMWKGILLVIELSLRTVFQCDARKIFQPHERREI